jgi:hypothetical protein
MKSKVYEGLTFYEVGSIVNSIKYDSPDCILPKNDYEEMLHKKGLGKFFTKVDKNLESEESKEEGKVLEKIKDSHQDNNKEESKETIKLGSKEESKKKDFSNFGKRTITQLNS